MVLVLQRLPLRALGLVVALLAALAARPVAAGSDVPPLLPAGSTVAYRLSVEKGGSGVDLVYVVRILGVETAEGAPRYRVHVALRLLDKRGDPLEALRVLHMEDVEEHAGRLLAEGRVSYNYTYLADDTVFQVPLGLLSRHPVVDLGGGREAVVIRGAVAGVIVYDRDTLLTIYVYGKAGDMRAEMRLLQARIGDRTIAGPGDEEVTRYHSLAPPQAPSRTPETRIEIVTVTVTATPTRTETVTVARTVTVEKTCRDAWTAVALAAVALAEAAAIYALAARRSRGGA